MTAALIIALITTLICIASPILLICSIMLCWDPHLIVIFLACVAAEFYCLMLIFYKIGREEIK